MIIAVVSAGLCVSADAVLGAKELGLFRTQLDNARAQDQYIHMVEFGGGNYEISELSGHEAVVSWSLTAHDPDAAASLKEQFRGSSRVSVKHIPGDFSIWDGKLKLPAEEEGTLADYNAYVSEILFFGAKDKAAFWVFNNGKAKVDIGVAALPLLVRTNGLMLVSGWNSNECYAESLLQFYDAVETLGALAVLRPKDPSLFREFAMPDSTYNWCFSIVSGGKVVKDSNGPIDASLVFDMMQKDNVGCADIGGGVFHCSDDHSKCTSCYGLMMAISGRGQEVKKSARKVMELYKQKEDL